MHENNKTYGSVSLIPCSSFTPTEPNLGFTVAIYEFRRTIESLWSTVKGILPLTLDTPTCGFVYVLVQIL